MREEGKGEGAELQRSVEQWQFTTPPSWGVKCLGKFTTLSLRWVVDQTSLQPSEPDRGGSGEQERVSSSETDNKLKILLPVNKKAPNYKEWRSCDLFRMTSSPSNQSFRQNSSPPLQSASWDCYSEFQKKIWGFWFFWWIFFGRKGTWRFAGSVQWAPSQS